jgi:hypothetical protein
MAYFLTPQEARNLWGSYKKAHLTYGHQKRFEKNWFAQGGVSKTPYFWNMYGKVGQPERMAHANLQRKLIAKYHWTPTRPRYGAMWPNGGQLTNLLKPIYGFGGAINKIRRARPRLKERAAVEPVRGGLERWRVRAGTRLAERMLSNRLVEKMRNIERKIALVRRANNANKAAARLNARRAINNSGLNANLKAMYYINLNALNSNSQKRLE